MIPVHLLLNIDAITVINVEIVVILSAPGERECVCVRESEKREVSISFSHMYVV